MRKICIVFNHLQISDGVTKAAIRMANYLAEHCQASVCLYPLYRFDPRVQETIHQDVMVKPLFGFYFRGFAKLLDKIPVQLLYRWTIKEKYDIEIGFQQGIATKMVAASRNAEARHIGWLHGYDYGLTQKADYLKMDQMICVSRCNAERLSRELENKVPVDYSYNLIDEEIIQTKGQLPVESPEKKGMTFVTVGRLSPEKGFSRLLDCVFRLKADGYALTLWLIGNGPENDNLRKQADRLALNDTVCFLGEQKNPHMYTEKADMFVCSSYSEGYSTACAEAVILGVPVLTTSVSGGEEIIEASEAGMLVGMEDEDLYQGMKTILDHPELVKTWKQTLQRTRERFYQSARAEKLIEILELDKK